MDREKLVEYLVKNIGAMKFEIQRGGFNTTDESWVVGYKNALEDVLDVVNGKNPEFKTIETE